MGNRLLERKEAAANRLFSGFARLCAFLTAVMGLAGMVGWLAGIPLLATFGQGKIPMAPTTALLFLLYGTVLFAYTRAPQSRKVRTAGIALISAGIMLSLALFIIASAGIHPAFEHMGIQIKGFVQGAPIGHMSRLTAFCFLAAGFSSLLLILSPTGRRRYRLAAAFYSACAVLLSGIILTLAYMLGGPLFYGSRIIPPALTTSLAFMMAGLAIAVYSGGLRWLERHLSKQINSLKSGMVAGAAILLCAGIFAAGYFYFDNYREHFQSDIKAELGAIADMKVNELAQWRKERLADAGMFFKNVSFSSLVQSYFANPANPQMHRMLRDWLNNLWAFHQYERVSLVDIHGTERLVTPEAGGKMHLSFGEEVAAVLEAGQITFFDFHSDEPGESLHLSIMLPIFDEANHGKPLGALALLVDPAKYLYPVLRQWPASFQSGRMCLLRRKGETIQLLNDPKLRDSQAGNFPVELSKSTLPAAMAAGSGMANTEGTDYNGVWVVAAARRVPNSPWSLVVQMDTAEAYAPLRARLWQLLGLVAALLLGTGALAGLFRREQKTRFYREQFQAAEALRHSEERYRLISENTADVIWLLDLATLRFTYVSPSVFRLRGWTPEEIMEQPLEQALTPDSYRKVMEGLEKKLSAFRRGEDIAPAEVTEVDQLRKDGSIVNTEVVTTLLINEDGQPDQILGVSRDITKRKKAEQALQKKDLLLREMSWMAKIGGWEFDAATLEGTWTDEVARIHGLDPDAPINAELGMSFYKAESRERIEQAIKEAIESGIPYDLELELVTADGERKWVRTIGRPEKKGNKIAKVSGIFQDITELKRTQERVLFLSRLYATLSQINQTIVHTKDPDQLFRDICDVAVRFGKLQLAWIGLVDEKSGKLRPVAMKERKGELTPGDINTKRQRLFSDLAQQALMTGTIAVGDGIQNAENPEPEALRDGDDLHRATAVVPFCKKGKIYGVLSLSASESFLMDAEQKQLLEEIASDITYALDAIEGDMVRRQTENKLRTNEALLATAMKLAGMGYWEYNVGDDLFTFNDAFYAILRTTAEQEGGYTMSSSKYAERFVHPDDAVLIGKEVRAAIETDNPDYSRQLEHRIIFADGEPGFITVSFFVLKDEQGWTVKTFGVNQDISERKRAETALRESEARFRTAFEHSASGMALTGMDGSIEKANEPLCKMLGYSASELEGKHFNEITHPDDTRIGVDAAHRMLSGETQSLSFEKRYLKKSGEVVWIQFNAALLKDGNGNPEHFIAQMEDVTDRRRAIESLAESEERYRTLAEAAQDSIYIVGKDDTISYVNSAAMRFLRLPAEKIIGKKRSEFFPQPENNQQSENLQKIFETGISINHESSIPTPKGKIWLNTSLSPLRNKDGQIAAVLGISRNVTEYKEAETAIRDIAQSMAQAQQIAHFGSWEITLNPTPDTTDIFRNSDECYRIFGYEPGSSPSTARLLRRHTHPADLKSASGKFFAVVRNKTAYSDEFRIIRKDGAVRYIHNQGRPVFDEQTGEAIKLIGTIHDITERKEQEEALRQSEERLRTTLYSIGDGVITTNIKGEILQMNHVAEELTGWPESDAQGKAITEIFKIINEESRAPVANPVELVLEKETVVDLANHTLLVAQDGSERPIADSGAPIRNRRGEITGVVLVFNDQTERRELQARLNQAQKLEAVGRLAGGVAHDFNNMIGVILGYAQLLHSKLSPPDPLLKNVDAIIKAAERSANLTSQLLAFARKQVIRPVTLNLNESLEGLSKMLKRLIGEDISLSINPAGSLWNVRIDPTQVDQILANLSTNARDAIENVGTITIETTNVVIDEAYSKEHIETQPGEYAMLAFSDSGSGMSKETQARIFEPFFTTKPAGEGTGLGLATIFGIVKQNDGFINVYSEPDHGTTFKIYFPRFYGETDEPSELPQEISTKGSETILIVEDEEQLLELARLALDMQGYEVFTAKSPGVAILLFKKMDKKIDLVITDVVMPGMNGKELKEELEKMKPGIKVIFMSGYTANVVAHRGILDEGVNFLQKPFTPSSLARKVREVLNA